MDITGKLVKRSDKVAFFELVGEDTSTFQRMQGFTDLSKSSNPIEYSRQYVDEEGERSDVTGYSPSYAYSFDQYTGNAVADEIARITDEECTGADAVRAMIVVDLTKPGKTEGSFAAVKRNFSIIPDSEGDSTDAYTYSGNIKANGATVRGEASSEDGWMTVTFTEEAEA